MKKYFTAIILFSLFFATHFSYAKNIKNKEKIIFQCNLANKSTSQILHSVINGVDYYTYRNIKNGRKQIEITQTKTQTEKISWQNLLNPDGKNVNLFFSNGIYGYNVYSGFGIPPELGPDDVIDDIILYAGIIISKKDKNIQTIGCNTNNKNYISISDEYSYPPNP